MIPTSLPRVTLHIVTHVDEVNVCRTIFFVPHRVSDTRKSNPPNNIVQIYTSGDPALGNMIMEYGYYKGTIICLVVIIILKFLPASLQQTFLAYLLHKCQQKFKNFPTRPPKPQKPNQPVITVQGLKRDIEVRIDLHPPRLKTEVAAKALVLGFDPIVFKTQYLDGINGINWEIVEDRNTMKSTQFNAEFPVAKCPKFMRQRLLNLNHQGYLLSFKHNDLLTHEAQLQQLISQTIHTTPDTIITLSNMESQSEDATNAKLHYVFSVIQGYAKFTTKDKLRLLFSCQTFFRVFYPCTTFNGRPLLPKYKAKAKKEDDEGSDKKDTSTESKKLLHIYAFTGNNAAISTVIRLCGSWCLKESTGFLSRSPLQLAASRGLSDTVRLLAYFGAPLDARDCEGRTALHSAVSSVGRRVETLRTLLQLGAQVDTIDSKGNSALSGIKEDIGVARVLLQYGANPLLLNNKGHAMIMKPLLNDLSSSDSNMTQLLKLYGGKRNRIHKMVGDQQALVYSQATQEELDDMSVAMWSPLHEAARLYSTKSASALLNQGAKVNLPSLCKRDTPLHMAARYGHTGVVDYLIKVGADINAKNKKERTPLHEAARNSHLYSVDALLRAGCKIDEKDKHGNTSLMLATESADVTKRLLKAGADASIQGPIGRLAVHIASWTSWESSKLLLDANPNSLSQVDNFGYMPIHLASWGGSVDGVKMLIERGADINVRNTSHSTPLILAASENRNDACKLLLDHGAEVDVEDDCDHSAMTYACKNGNLDLVTTLLDARATTDPPGGGRVPLHLAIKYGHIAIVKKLLAHGADKDSISWNDLTPLQVAAKYGRLDSMRALFIAGAEASNTAESQTLLHVAADMGHLPVVEELLLRKVPLDEMDYNDETPLHLASINGHVNVVRALLKAGAKIDPQNWSGRTPLHVAARTGEVEVVRELISKGARMKVHLALELAVKEGHATVVKELLRGLKPSPRNKENVLECLEKAERKGRVSVLVTLRWWIDLHSVS